MKKHEGYQKILEQGEITTEKGFYYRISTKYNFLKKLYWRLSRIALYNIHKIPNINTAKHILDIGCGSGATLNYIKIFNRETMLYSVDLEQNYFLSEDINFSFCDIDKDKLPFDDNSMDIVISTFLLEHLHNPQKLFKEAYRVLNPEGYFYCVTEYYTSLFLPDYWNFYQDPTHVRPWTKRALASLSKMVDFKIQKIGRIRPIEYFLLLPALPIINLFSKSKNSFLFYELISGRTIYLICKK